MVTWENYEEYMILHVDGELSDAERKALLEFLQVHPELQDELKMYQSARLMPDTALVYNGKEALLKPVPNGKVISLGQWWRYGAAAGVALVMLFAASRWINNGNDTEAGDHKVAKTKTSTGNPSVSGPLHPTQSSFDPKGQPQINTPVIRREESISVARHSVHSNTKSQVIQNASSNKTELEIVKPVVYELEVASIEPALIDPVQIPVAEQVPQETRKEEYRKDFIARLPVDSEKKEGLRGLKENISAKVEQARSFPATIKETAVALKIGNKEFTINF